MVIDFKEGKKSLDDRIDIHTLYGSHNIDDWMLDLVSLESGSKILDLGCGSGKQSFLIYNHLNGECEVLGTDESEDLLQKARDTASKSNLPLSFTKLDFDTKFPFEDNTFDFVVCSFAIYYADNIEFTLSEIYRIMKLGGTMLLVGPMPNNKKEFHDIIENSLNCKIPPLVGSSRFSTVILNTVTAKFQETSLYVFKNTLTFPNPAPLLNYTEASLSKTRGIYSKILEGRDYNDAIQTIENHVNVLSSKNKKLVMTKIVGGILAKKL